MRANMTYSKSAKKTSIPAEFNDFRNFLWLVWQHLGLPEPTPVQYDIAQAIQDAKTRTIVEAFRGVGKSYITSAYVVWKLLLDPEHKFLVVSASKSRADDFSTFTLRLINEMPILAPLIPLDEQRYSKVAFDVGTAAASHSPSVKSIGITGMMTGSRADTVIADDVESLNNSLTQGNRDRISETVKEFEAILKPNGRILYLGTPQCEMSLYNSLQERGYVATIWPARYPDASQRTNYGSRLAPMIQSRVDGDPQLIGTSVDPKRFTDIDLKEREASYGRSSFALQFLLDTTLSDQNKYPLKLSDLNVLNLDSKQLPSKVVWSPRPELVINDIPVVGLAGDKLYSPAHIEGPYGPPTGCVMAIDPSGRGRDETAFCVVKIMNSQLYLVASGGFSDGYSDSTLEGLMLVAKHHGVNHIIVESNFGDGMFTQLMKPVSKRIYPVMIEEVRHSKQKEARIIDTLEPVLNQHRLMVDRKVIDNDYRTTQDNPQRGLMYQLTRITKERGALSTDDRLDALAIAVGYWTEQVAQGVDDAVKSQKEALLDEELQRFMEHTKGGKPRPDGFSGVFRSLKLRN